MKITNEITEIQLKDGFLVKVIDLNIKASYSNVWAGKPTPELNRGIVANGFRFSSDWPAELRVLLLRPKREILDSILPKFRITVWLDCYQAIDSVYDGSWLAVTFFSNDILEINIEKILQENLQDIDWKFSATDYFI